MNWLLLAVLAAFVLFAFLGYKKGLLQILFSFGSLVIALFVSYLVTPSVTTYLKENTQLYATVQEKTQAAIADMIANNASDAQTEGTDDAAQQESSQTEGSAQEVLENVLETLHMPELLQEQITQTVSQAEEAGAVTIVQMEEAIGSRIAEMVISAAAFIITLLIVRVLLWVVYAVLDMVSRLPVIHGINQMLGMIVGLAEGLFVVWIFFAFLTCVMQTSFGQSCLEMISENAILRALYNANVLRFMT